jgi:threonine/homoserine/homoserine lactone efflux protein
MPAASTLAIFALICIGMVLTPGPNMVYLVSRSISQGRTAGLISLTGVAVGLVFYVCCASLGITSLFVAVPFAYEALKLCGAAYLLYLAWQAVKPGGRSPFQVKNLPVDGPRKLFSMGLVTALLNPKVAVLYLSLLPQFIHPERGSVLVQSLVLGFTQVLVSMTFNSLIVIVAGLIAAFLASRPKVMVVQRWLMCTVLAGFAVRMAAER